MMRSTTLPMPRCRPRSDACGLPRHHQHRRRIARGGRGLRAVQLLRHAGQPAALDEVPHADRGHPHRAACGGREPAGSVAELWAGPLSIATGVEYRHDSTSLQHDTLSNSFAYFQNFGADYNASQDVTEAYLETEVPLLRDLPLANALNFNAAIRRTRYDIEGFGSYN